MTGLRNILSVIFTVVVLFVWVVKDTIWQLLKQQ